MIKVLLYRQVSFAKACFLFKIYVFLMAIYEFLSSDLSIVDKPLLLHGFYLLFLLNLSHNDIASI